MDWNRDIIRQASKGFISPDKIVMIDGTIFTKTLDDKENNVVYACEQIPWLKVKADIYGIGFTSDDESMRYYVSHLWTPTTLPIDKTPFDIEEFIRHIWFTEGERLKRINDTGSQDDLKQEQKEKEQISLKEEEAKKTIHYLRFTTYHEEGDDENAIYTIEAICPITGDMYTYDRTLMSEEDAAYEARSLNKQKIECKH